MTDTAAPAKPPKAPKTALNATRSFWLKQLYQWRWIPAALRVRGAAVGDQLTYNPQYNGVMEGLP